MIDSILAHLQEARADALDERSGKSRELSLVITKIDEAILWRERDIRLRTPAINEKAG